MIKGNSISSVSAATATGAGTDADVRDARAFSAVVVASSVTSGGTVKIQGTEDQTNYFDLATVTVSADGAQEVVVEFPPTYVRGNVTARTDGTYTVTIHPITER